MTDRETRTALPSSPVAAHRGWVKPVPRRSRLELVIWGTAVLFGSTIGGTLALRAEPASSQPAAVHPMNGAPGAATTPDGGAAATTSPGGGAAATTNPGGGAAATTNPGGAAATTNPGSATATTNPGRGAAATTSPAGGVTAATAASAERAAAIGQISDALRRFVSWSRGHAGARCPDAAVLGAPPDPWGHALRITCTDQPADQIAGAVSAGPDGVAGTRDDIESWTLGDAVTDLVRGPRWRASRTGTRRSGGAAITAAPQQSAPPASTTAQPRKPPASPGAGSSDNDGDGIPDRR